MESCFLGSQGWSPGLGVGGCLLGRHCLGRSLEERGARVVLAPRPRAVLGFLCHRPQQSPEEARRGRHLPGGPEMASPHFRECAVSQFKQILVVLLNHELSALYYFK